MHELYTVTNDGDCLKKSADPMNPEEDNVGDIRIRYYTHSEFLQSDHIPVSIIGRQKGRTIASNEDSTFLISLGENKSLKQLIHDET